MTGELTLRNVILRLKLGELPEETITRRDVPVDISWTGSTGPGMSVDYSQVCSMLEKVEDEDFLYIEDLASRILQMLRGEFPEGSWKVTVIKPCPPVSLKMESASFTIEGGDDV